MGFRKPKFEIGVLRTKVGYGGMKNEIQEVGYQKPDSTCGVLRTKTQRRGTMILSKGKGYRVVND